MDVETLKALRAWLKQNSYITGIARTFSCVTCGAFLWRGLPLWETSSVFAFTGILIFFDDLAVGRNGLM